jgi:hypothetical protein
MHIDELLMKMVSYSLEAHYIPVKKLTMLYTKVLSNIFYHGASKESSVNPASIFDSAELILLAHNNLLRTNELESLKNKHTLKHPHEKLSPVEQFYVSVYSFREGIIQEIVLWLSR